MECFTSIKNHLAVFFNTELVDNPSYLSTIGDYGLAPIRYFLNGQTIFIEKGAGDHIQMHRVTSFHDAGQSSFHSKANVLESNEAGCLFKLLFVVLCIPGLALASFKLLAYVFADVREAHDQILNYLAPEPQIVMGSENHIGTEIQLWNEFNKICENLNDKTLNTLVIHAESALTVNNLSLNRMQVKKVIMENCTISDNFRYYLTQNNWKIVETPQTVEDALDMTPEMRSYTEAYQTLYITQRK